MSWEPIHRNPWGRYDAWRCSNGEVVRHCGHPTALRPYYIDGKLEEVGTFRLLKEAKAAAEALS